VSAAAADLGLGAAFLATLGGYLRHPLTPDQARLALRARLDTREESFWLWPGVSCSSIPGARIARSSARRAASFDKLKVGGIPPQPEPLARLFEEGLPRRFGGGPTDYQLVEEDAEVEGGPREYASSSTRR
jgi:hypothetical protein